MNSSDFKNKMLETSFIKDKRISLLRFDKDPFIFSIQDGWDLVEKIFGEFVEKRELGKNPPSMEVNKNGISFKVVVSHNYYFWKELESGKWEPYTFDIFDRFITNDCTYIDIGAWIGPTALYGSNLAKAAYAFEPDPLAYKELQLNFQVNEKSKSVKRIEIFNKAVASKTGKIKIGNLGSGGNSASSILFSDSNVSWKVDSVKLDEFLESKKIQGKLFIKMDIEGGNMNLFLL